MLIGARVVAGRRRCADEPGDALDHLGDVRPASSAGWRSGSGPASRRSRSRSARSSAACSPSTSAGTGSSSSTSRSASLAHRRELPLHRRVEGHDARAAARPARASPRPAIGLFALTYGLIEANDLRLDVRPHPRLVRRRRRLLWPRSSCSSGASGCRCST